MKTKTVTTTEYYKWSPTRQEWVPVDKSVKTEETYDNPGIYRPIQPYVYPPHLPTVTYDTTTTTWSTGEPHTEHNYD